MYEPVVAGHIVNACAVLHNMRLHYRLPQDEFQEAERPIRPVQAQAPPDAVGGRRAEGIRVQEQIIRNHFR